jgi:hypothetical protein
MQLLVGETYGWIPTNSSTGGSTSTGLSLASLTDASGSTYQFQVTRFANNISDSLTDQYIVATVRINVHQYKAAVANV